MSRPTKFSPEVQERAVRLVLEHQGEYESQWAAIRSVASKIGCTAESLRRWLRQAVAQDHQDPGALPQRRRRQQADLAGAAKHHGRSWQLGTRMARGDESVCHRVRGSIYRQCCVTIGNRLAGTGRPSPLAAKVDASLTHKNSDTPELRGRPNDRGAECHLVLSPRLLDKLLHRKP